MWRVGAHGGQPFCTAMVAVNAIAELGSASSNLMRRHRPTSLPLHRGDVRHADGVDGLEGEAVEDRKGSDGDMSPACGLLLQSAEIREGGMYEPPGSRAA